MRTRSPAKINLGLEILSRREDGFHELCSVMLAIDLRDEVEVLPGRDVRDSDFGAGFSRTGLTDHALRAFRERSRVEHHFQARVRKNVPAAAGLGGGSSNAASALTAANRLSGNPLSGSELAGVAARVGSDVAFFLTGGCALVAGRGEIRERELPVPKVWIVLANPGIELATPDVFGELRQAEFSDGARTRELAQSIAAGRPHWSLMRNGLQAAATRLCPPVRQTLDAIRQHSPWVLLSGSGATCFGIFESRSTAEAAREDLALRGYWTWAGRPLSARTPAGPRT